MPPRPKSPLSLWVVRNRKRLKKSTGQIGALIDASDDTVRGWEAGRRPSAANLDALEQLFGEEAPDRNRSDDGDLAAALDRQTEAITALVARLDRLAVGQLESTDAILRAIAATVGAPVPSGTSSGNAPAELAGTRP